MMLAKSITAAIAVLLVSLHSTSAKAAPSKFTFCANEGQTCYVTGTQDVAFGADTPSTSYTILDGVVGSTACTVSAFQNHDPAPNVSKACYTTTANSGPVGWPNCSNENQNCNSGSFHYIAFGHKNRFGSPNGFIVANWPTTGLNCVTSNFGGYDPAPGATKACYYSNQPGLPTTQFTACANENQQCYVGLNANQAVDVMYGPANGPWLLRTGIIMPASNPIGFTCSNSFFGYDPAPGVAKSCSVSGLSGPAGTTAASAEGGSFGNFPQSTTQAIFGANGVFILKDPYPQTTMACTVASFGGWDPNPNYAKTCFHY